MQIVIICTAFVHPLGLNPNPKFVYSGDEEDRTLDLTKILA